MGKDAQRSTDAAERDCNDFDPVEPSPETN